MIKPRILISTASDYRSRGLRRTDTVGGVNYAEAIVRTGGLPLFAPNLAPETASAYLATADGLVLSGGADLDPVHYGQAPHPELGLVDERRDLFELALYRAARARGLPVLGVCRGFHVLNVAEGGTLHQHLPALATTAQHDQRNTDGSLFHAVRLEPGSLLHKAFGEETVRTNSYHHQAINALGDNLRAVAWADDGTVEAAEGTTKTFLLGVQWHPEMSFERYPEQIAPFQTFMNAVLRQTVESPLKLMVV